MFNTFKNIIIISIVAFLALACGSSSDSPPAINSIEKQVITVTRSSDYSSASFSISDINTYATNSTIKAYDTSDIAIRTFNDHFYVIGRFSSDFVEKYHRDAPTTNIYPTAYKTIIDGEASMNPHDLIFQSESKAYLTRYGSGKQWIVNPSATTEDDFKIKEINLSAYDEGDGSPEISQGVIVGGKLFLGVQRLNNYVAENNGYLSVIDTTTDNEVDTKKDTILNLKGIPLPANNPGKIVYSEITGLIYIVCVGKFYSDLYPGGIITVNPSSYETTTLIEDKSAISYTDIAIVNKDKGYLVYSEAWGDSRLRSFNPSTGELSTEITALSGQDVYGINVDQNGKLWISTTKNGLYILNTSDDSVIIEGQDVGLIPNSAPVILKQ